MENRLYIGNLPYTVDEQQLADIFSGMGYAVSKPHVVKDRETGQSRGFGFVEAESPAKAQEIIAATDGTEVGHRTIRVTIANPRPARTTGGPAGFNKQGGFNHHGGEAGGGGGAGAGGGGRDGRERSGRGRRQQWED